MNKKYVEAFNAVSSFIDDLWLVFGNPKKVSPLALYRRLISHIKSDDSESINKVLSGFRQFLSTYEDSILNDKLDLIPRQTRINYGQSKTVYLEIQKYIYLSDEDTREAIRQHLIAISAIIDPDDRKIDELQKRLNELNIDDSTAEGQFITGIMSKAKGTMQNVDADNPGQAIIGLLSSGVIQDMVFGIQTGVSDGSMDLQKLLGSMQSAIGALVPPPSNASSGPLPIETGVEEVIDESDEIHLEDDEK